MSYLLRISAELHDWLADLRRSDPPAAMLVAQALTALMSEGARLGPPRSPRSPSPRCPAIWPRPSASPTSSGPSRCRWRAGGPSA